MFLYLLRFGSTSEKSLCNRIRREAGHSAYLSTDSWNFGHLHIAPTVGKYTIMQNHAAHVIYGGADQEIFPGKDIELMVQFSMLADCSHTRGSTT